MKWLDNKITMENNLVQVVEAKCSECNKYSSQTVVIYSRKEINYNYCPRCGAKREL